MDGHSADRLASRRTFGMLYAEALLERIISNSNNPGAVVLDPLCGCGTTITAAQKLDRKWVELDFEAF